MHGRTILFFGHSHVNAVQQALAMAGGGFPDFAVKAYSMTRIKNGTLIGDIHLEDLIQVCATLSDTDLVVSMFGGNQHSALSLIQHPEPFDILGPTGGGDAPGAGVALVPYNAAKSVYLTGLPRDTVRVLRVARAAPCRTVHLSAPPPKADEEHILRRVESDFAARGIQDKGVSPAPLRLKMWGLQNDALAELLASGGVDLVPPPEGTTTEDGFLKPEFYAKDATHANRAYGLKVIEQVVALATTPVPASGRAERNPP